MSSVKKTSFMILASVLLFLLLSYFDEFENLFLSNSGLDISAVDPYDVEATLKSYLENLPKVYLGPDLSLVKEMPVSDELAAELAADIEYLKQDGRILELDIQDMTIRSADLLGLDKARLETGEIIGVRYLGFSDRKEIRSVAPAVFEMSYLFEKGEKGWVITRYDVLKIDKITDGRELR